MEDSVLPIPPIISILSDIFNKNGYQLYLVGGTVRDWLLKTKPKDYDLVTNATPSQTIEILKDGFKISKQGESFGVIALYLKEEPYELEIASFQTRHNGTIVTGTTIDQDVLRRDLTINALYYDLVNKKIIDLVDGINDLRQNVIRTVGDPNDRFQEDPLRIQRVLRFLTRFQSSISKNMSKAIIDSRELIIAKTPERPNGVSQERIYHEVEKAFKSCHHKFQPYIGFLNNLGLWPYLFPGCSTTIQERYLETDNFSVCLAQMFIDEPEDVFSGKDALAVRSWKFPRRLTDQVNILHQLKNLDIENVVQLALKVESRALTKEVLENWFEVCNLTDSPFHQTFLSFNYREVTSEMVINKHAIKKGESAKIGKLLLKERQNLFHKKLTLEEGVMGWPLWLRPKVPPKEGVMGEPKVPQFVSQTPRF